MTSLSLFIDCSQTIDCLTEFLTNLSKQTIFKAKNEIELFFVCSSCGACSYIESECSRIFKDVKMRVIDSTTINTNNSGWIHITGIAKQYVTSKYLYLLSGNCFFNNDNTVELMLEQLLSTSMPISTLTNINILHSHDDLLSRQQKLVQNFIHYETFFSTTLVETAWFFEAFTQYLDNNLLNKDQIFNISERFLTGFKHVVDLEKNIIFDSSHSCTILDTYKIGWWHKLNVFAYYTYNFDANTKQAVVQSAEELDLLSYIDIVYRRIMSGRIDISKIDLYIANHTNEILNLLTENKECLSYIDSLTMCAVAPSW